MILNETDDDGDGNSDDESTFSFQTPPSSPSPPILSQVLLSPSPTLPEPSQVLPSPSLTLPVPSQVLPSPTLLVPSQVLPLPAPPLLSQAQSLSQSELVKCPHCDKLCKGTRGTKIHIAKVHPNIKNTTSASIQNVIQIDRTTSQNPILLPPSSQSITNSDSLLGQLTNFKSNVHVLKRIPKGARHAASTKLSQVIEQCLTKNDIQSWEKLLLFSYTCLRVPEKIASKSLTSSVKENIQTSLCPTFHKKNKKKGKKTESEANNISKRIEAKLCDFDTRGAIRILSSNDTLAPITDENLAKLNKLHPPPSRPSIPDDEETCPCSRIEVDMKTLVMCIGSFPNGSAGGIDGLTSQHLKDLTAKSAGDAGMKLLDKIKKLIDLLLNGQVNEEILPFLYGATLCALNKKDGGLRPIAVGCVFRRLAAKVGCLYVQDGCSAYFKPNQFGFSCNLGCESVVHATRSYIKSHENSNFVLVKIDYQNAFNCVERDSMLKEIQTITPTIFPFMSQAYSKPSFLFYGPNIILSQRGTQQGDPCSSLAFSLTIHPIIKKLKSELNLFYLDDGTLGGPPEIVLEDIKTLLRESENVGLKVNPAKCELYFTSRNVDSDVVQDFHTILPGIKTMSNQNLSLLGAPLVEEGYAEKVQEKSDVLKLACQRLKEVPAHIAYYLLKNCLGIPKMMYLLRTVSTWKCADILFEMDRILKSTLEEILNISLSGPKWFQASLPIRNGGLGIRSLLDLALPAYLASCYGSKMNVSIMLSKPVDTLILQHEQDGLDLWHSKYDNIPSETQLHFQGFWDEIVVKQVIENEMKFEDNADKARFLALQKSEANAWLFAIPCKNIGTQLTNNTLRICMGLRLGCVLSANYTCICGEAVSPKSLHPLSCSRSAGRFHRHGEINDILKRTLSSLNIPATLEPTGLSRNDGKRPDGVTLIPWANGKSLVWDATCVDTFAPSYLMKTCNEAGAAAEVAAKKKEMKYSNIKNEGYLFRPFAVETMGAWSVASKEWLGQLGEKLFRCTGEPRSKHFLVQRIGLAIQKGNAACILGSIPEGVGMDEVFYL